MQRHARPFWHARKHLSVGLIDAGRRRALGPGRMARRRLALALPAKLGFPVERGLSRSSVNDPV